MDTLEKILQKLKRDVRPQTVSVYTRHSATCDHREDKNWKRCNCPKYLYVFQNGDQRFSAKTRAWEKAESLKRELEDALDPYQVKLRKLQEAEHAKRIPISDAIDTYLADAKKRGLKAETLRHHERLFGRKLRSWAEDNRLSYLDELVTAQLTKWRTTWTMAQLATQKAQERVKQFFNFCVRQGWLTQNPASLLSAIQVPKKKINHFTPAEMRKLTEATNHIAQRRRSCEVIKGTRLRALMLLMRWSGLRISDAVTLERNRLQGNNLLLYQRKTETPVFVPLPPHVAELLRKLPDGMKPNARYFFWTGSGRPLNVVKYWLKAFRRLFKIAKLQQEDGTAKWCHSHMFRHSFAISNLEAGMPIEEVSILLGHSSLRITEKHYAPWVKGRQDRLERSVHAALMAQGALESGGNEGSPFPATMPVA